MTSRCIRKREIEDSRGVGIGESEPDVASGDPGVAEPTAVPEGGNNLRRSTMDMLSSFVEALETAPANLFRMNGRRSSPGS